MLFPVFIVIIIFRIVSIRLYNLLHVSSYNISFIISRRHQFSITYIITSFTIPRQIKPQGPSGLERLVQQLSPRIHPRPRPDESDDEEDAVFEEEIPEVYPYTPEIRIQIRQVYERIQVVYTFTIIGLIFAVLTGTLLYQNRLDLEVTIGLCALYHATITYYYPSLGLGIIGYLCRGELRGLTTHTINALSIIFSAYYNIFANHSHLRSFPLYNPSHHQLHRHDPFM